MQKITKDQVGILVSNFVQKQNLKIKSTEEVGGYKVHRISAANGAVVSSLTIPPGVYELPVLEAQKYIAAIVHDMCRACAAEPAARG